MSRPTHRLVNHPNIKVLLEQGVSADQLANSYLIGMGRKHLFFKTEDKHLPNLKKVHLIFYRDSPNHRGWKKYELDSLKYEGVSKVRGENLSYFSFKVDREDLLTEELFRLEGAVF